MAKKKATGSETTDAKVVNKGFTEHHRDLESTGAINVHASRPRGKPYTIEEWLTPSRQLVIVKAYDDGRLVKYNEDASFTDPKAAAENMR